MFAAPPLPMSGNQGVRVEETPLTPADHRQSRAARPSRLAMVLVRAGRLDHAMDAVSAAASRRPEPPVDADRWIRRS
jgi:hypothetical protein